MMNIKKKTRSYVELEPLIQLGIEGVAESEVDGLWVYLGARENNPTAAGARCSWLEP